MPLAERTAIMLLIYEIVADEPYTISGCFESDDLLLAIFNNIFIERVISLFIAT